MTLKRNEPIRSIMTPDPISVDIDESISKVRRILAEIAIHHVPVTRGGKLVGIVSSTDMMRLSLDAWGSDAEAVDAMLDSQFRLESIMQASPVCLKEDDTVRSAAEALAHGRFHSIPVVDDDDRPVGIVTSTDLIAYLLKQY